MGRPMMDIPKASYLYYIIDRDTQKNQAHLYFGNWFHSFRNEITDSFVNANALVLSVKNKIYFQYESSPLIFLCLCTYII